MAGYKGKTGSISLPVHSYELYECPACGKVVGFPLVSTTFPSFRCNCNAEAAVEMQSLNFFVNEAWLGENEQGRG